MEQNSGLGRIYKNDRIENVDASLGTSGSATFHKKLPLWVKIVVPCVVAIVIVLVVLAANGFIGGSRGVDNNATDTVTVPNVVSEYYEDAITIAEQADMLLVITGKENNESVELNHILSQDPRAKLKAPNGSALLSVVSGGVQAPVISGIVPDITFILEGEAIALLESAELNYNINYVESDTVLSGLVVSQSTSPGSSNEQEVGVNVSTGSIEQDEALDKTTIDDGGDQATEPNTTVPNEEDPPTQGTKSDEETQEENTNIIVEGIIIENFVEYIAQWQVYFEQNSSVGMPPYGIRFSDTIEVEIDGTAILINEALLGHPRIGTAEELAGRPARFSGYFVRNPYYKEGGLYEQEIDGQMHYTYNPNGEYVFMIESYELL